MPTVTQIITQIAPISEYLVSNDVANGVLFGARPNAMLPNQIYIETQSCLWLYNLENIIGGSIPSKSLTSTSNYLYAICGQYGVAAFALVNSGGVLPVTGVVPTQYGYPMSGYYIAAVDGESVINLTLPTGSKVVQVFKSINWMITTDYIWVQPTLTLLNGISMSAGEKISYLYVVPI